MSSNQIAQFKTDYAAMMVPSGIQSLRRLYAATQWRVVNLEETHVEVVNTCITAGSVSSVSDDDKSINKFIVPE